MTEITNGIRKCIIVIFGLPGSGKTFFAKKMTKELGAVYIGSDEIRIETFRRGKYDLKSKQAIYLDMLVRTEQTLRHDPMVILDATFYLQKLRERFITKAADLHVPLYFIEVEATETIITERLKQKRADSEADLHIYQQLKEEFEPLAESHLILHSDEMTITEMIRLTLAYIGYSDGKARN